MNRKQVFLKRVLISIFTLFSIFFYASSGLAMVTPTPEALKISAGANRSLAVMGDNTLWAWGYNLPGQLTDTTIEDKNIPTRIGTDWLTIEAGAYHTIGIKTDGTLWSWGNNWYGQLGDGTTTNKETRTQIGTDYWMSIAAGGSHNAAIKTNGTLWSWGYNWDGQLGDGTTSDRYFPVQIGADANWKEVAAGESYTLAIKTDGTLWAWGANWYGQLGDGTTINRRTPVLIGTSWKAAAAGYAHTAGLKTDGTLWTWGWNGSGQLGDGTAGDEAYEANPVQVGYDYWTSIDAGVYHTIGIRADGSLWSWGGNRYGQLGDGTAADNYTPSQISINGTDGWLGIAAGDLHTLAVTTDGTIWTWGANWYGQLGNGTKGLGSKTPSIIGPEIGAGWTSIDVGGSHTAGIKNDGSLWSWGGNDYGQVGDGTNVSKNKPELIGTNFAAIDAGGGHTAGIKDDGSLWSWGANWYGQIGNGAITDENEPVQIGFGFQKLSAGNSHTAAIKTNGSLWTWGWNVYGQLGDKTETDRYTPVLIGTGWKDVSAGLGHTAGIKTNGTLWAWGGNSYGQLGIGTLANKNNPVQVGNSNDWASVSAGMLHTMAIKTDGTLWAWGYNRDGQLGDGTFTDKSRPVQIGTGWLYVSAGYYYTTGIKTDGTLWAWGENWSGQLGDGTKETRTRPVQIGTDTDWLSVSAGDSHTTAIKTNGSLWAWGENYYGQLGDGVAWMENPLQVTTTPCELNPCIHLSSREFYFTVKASQSVTTVDMQNTAGTILPQSVKNTQLLSIDGQGQDWTASSNAAWLNITPASGGLILSVDTTGLDAGIYSTTVIVSAPNTSYQTARVRLRVVEEMVITTNSLPEAKVDEAYKAQLTATGGIASYKWSVISGILPAGLSLSRSGLISGAPLVQGTYNFQVMAEDSDHSVVTKQLSIKVTLLQGPNLVVSSLKAPESAISGKPILISDITKNKGTAKAPETNTRYYLSANTKLDSKDVYLEKRNVPSLAAGALSTGKKSVTIPASTPAGVSYIIAVADANKVVAESVEGNNTMVTAITITKPDLVITSLAAPSSGSKGKTISIIDTTTNKGLASKSSVTKYYLSLNKSVEKKDMLLGSRPVPGLPQDEFSQGGKIVKIPNKAFGKYYIIAVADANKTILESDEKNNIAVVEITIE